ncbi:MAG: HAMP domain-containing histidine kinase [Prolixibacteraceae bacterium]|nr:HAMP domain-containing histidine kinase [Prolixibacteraceae bacterium]
MDAIFILIISHLLLQVKLSVNYSTILLDVLFFGVLFFLFWYFFFRSEIRLLKKRNGELKKDITKLKNEIVNNTEKLQAALDKAEEANRLKSLFLANMSHEIRTPLNGIVGFSELIADQDSGPEMKNQFASQIIQGSEQLLKIIDQIFHLSIIEAGKVSLYRERFERKLFFQSIEKNFRRKIKHSGRKINFILSMYEEQSSLYTDKDKLRLIIENLLENALKFTERGSIELGFIKDNNDFLFSISDTGCGIDEDEYDIIFDPFIQGRETLKKIKGGSGLSLSNVKNYIMLLGGKIWCTKNYPKGLIFYFTIPDTSKKYQSGMAGFSMARN